MLELAPKDEYISTPRLEHKVKRYNRNGKYSLTRLKSEVAITKKGYPTLSFSPVFDTNQNNMFLQSSLNYGRYTFFDHYAYAFANKKEYSSMYTTTFEHNLTLDAIEYTKSYLE